MDHILHKHGVSSQRYFFVGLRGWDDSEAQWISKVEVKMLQLSLWNGNSDLSLDFAYITLLSYGLGIGARTTCMKLFMLHPLWDSLGFPRPFWCKAVVGPKPFVVAQHVH